MVEHAKNHIFSKRSDLWFPEAESGENRLEEGGQSVQTSSYKRNKY